MSTTAPAGHTGLTSLAELSSVKLSFGGVLRSEWIKLRTVRSTVWCYAIIVVVTLGFGLLVASLTGNGNGGLTGDDANLRVVLVGTIGVNITQLIVAVLGALIITGEYSTGMIRSTFTTVPKRLGALFAKAVILAATTFIVSAVSIWLTVLVTAPILRGKNIDVNLGDSAVWMPLLGASVYIALIAVLAFGFGLLLRSTAGGIATILGLLLIAPVLVSVLSSLIQADWINNLGQFLPGTAGGQLFSYASSSGSAGVSIGSGGPGGPGAAAATTSSFALNGWGGFGVLAGWDVVIGGIALYLSKRRDA